MYRIHEHTHIKHYKVQKIYQTSRLLVAPILFKKLKKKSANWQKDKYPTDIWSPIFSCYFYVSESREYLLTNILFNLMADWMTNNSKIRESDDAEMFTLFLYNYINNSNSWLQRKLI